MEEKKIGYFEVEFSSGDENTAHWICIRGTDQPTIEEAQKFLAKDSEMYGHPVAGVYPIDEVTARSCYDFENEAKWPIFTRESSQSGWGDDGVPPVDVTYPLTIGKEALQTICMERSWFSSGTNAQYEKLFWAQENGASIAELSLIIWLCTAGVSLLEIQETLLCVEQQMEDQRTAGKKAVAKALCRRFGYPAPAVVEHILKPQKVTLNDFLRGFLTRLKVAINNGEPWEGDRDYILRVCRRNVWDPTALAHMEDDPELEAEAAAEERG